MFLHHLLFTLRSFSRNRLSTVVGVLSLAVGAFCLIAAWVFTDYLRSGERQFAKSDRIHVVYQSLTLPVGINVPLSPMSSAPLAERLAIEFPELEAVARAVFAEHTLVSAEGRASRLDVVAADPDFLEIFDLPFLTAPHGNPLAEPGGAIITTAAAEALFGTADAVGRTLRIQSGHDVTIVAVVDPISAPSHLAKSFLWDGFELLVPWETLREDAQEDGSGQAWLSGYGVITYALLPEDRSITLAQLNASLAGFSTRHVPSDIATAQVEARHVSRFVPDFYQAIFVGDAFGPFAVTDLLLVLGLLALLIACINFVNLSTAAAMRRGKEIGMRRTLGATPAGVARQHLVEVFGFAVLAVAVAITLVLSCAWVVRQQWGVEIPMPWSRSELWWFMAAVLMLMTVLGGAYPAFLLARVQPVAALRAGVRRGGGRTLQAILIGAQFAAATVLAIAVIVMLMQNAALRDANAAQAEDVLVTTANLQEAGIDPQIFATELLRSPAIRAVSTTGFPPWNIGFGGGAYRRSPDASAEAVMVQARAVGHEYFEAIAAMTLAGRTFQRDRADEAGTGSGPTRIVLDRRAARALGWTDPSDAVGQPLYAGFDGDASVEVVGVVDANPLTLVALTDAFAYRLDPQSAIVPLIRIARSELADALAWIDTVWEELAPGHPPEREFLDERFEQSYVLFESANRLFGALAVVTALIALSGLYSVASHVTNSRVREVGIRKVHGASSSRVLAELLTDFARPVIVAQVVAWPVAWLAARAYLDLFIERAELTISPFLIAFAGMLLVAVVAVAGQALGAARRSPALVLRHE